MNNQQDKHIESVTLVLPAYNESAAIGKLVNRAAGVLGGLRPEWHIIVVDDGSADDTAAQVEAIAAREPRVRAVKHGVNKGLGTALVTGMMSAIETDPSAQHLVVFMDADLTHPPETIAEMIKAAEDGADLVIASRFQPGSEQHGVPPFRMLMSWGARHMFRQLLRLPGVHDYTCGFRGFRASLIEAGLERFGKHGLVTRKGFACTDELLVHLSMLGPKIQEVPFILRYDLKPSPSKMKLGATIMETLKVMMEHRRRLREAKKNDE
ncbi:glycosyltransferase family 2 protein [bacterium]|nr:glycosyltransferase family 2 protein [bacterium]